MNEVRLLEIALEHKEHNCVAYLMIGFAGQYLEGEIDSAKDVFNKYFPQLPVEVLRLMAADNTFSCITEICLKALARKNG